jgi:divalent metal cation (Fe/Co/Zn/Cd) transporter
VNGLIHLRCMHLGPDDIIVAAKIDFDHSLTMAELAAAVDRTEVAIRAAAPLDMTIYIEPDIRRAITT